MRFLRRCFWSRAARSDFPVYLWVLTYCVTKSRIPLANDNYPYRLGVAALLRSHSLLGGALRPCAVAYMGRKRRSHCATSTARGLLLWARYFCILTSAPHRPRPACVRRDLPERSPEKRMTVGPVRVYGAARCFSHAMCASESPRPWPGCVPRDRYRRSLRSGMTHIH